MFSQRGQEEAPFELLIAVIIMGFVIFLGLQAIDYVSDEQCKAQIKYSANELKTVVQEVVAGNAKNIIFDPPRCFTPIKGKEEMKFDIVKDPLQCSRLCGGAKGMCFVFMYFSSEYNYNLCLETVSPQTTFYEGAPCDDLKNYVPINLKDDISRGDYEFINKSSSVDAFPKLCAYLRTENAQKAN